MDESSFRSIRDSAARCPRVGRELLSHEPAGREQLSLDSGAARPGPTSAADLPALIPFDGGAKKVLELAFRHALRMGHNYVGTEHVLLALLEHEDGSGVLTGLGVGQAEAETRIREHLERLTDS